MRAGAMMFWALTLFGFLPAFGGMTVRCHAMTSEVTLRVDSITVGRDTFTDVEVYKKTEIDVFIRHSKGLASFKVEDLNEDALIKLGYIEKNELIARAAALPASAADAAQASSLFERLKQSEFSLKTVLPGLIFAVGGYFYLSFLFWMICIKVGNKPGLPVWLPVLQIVPLLEAAGMSASWFLGLVIALAVGVLVSVSLPGFALAGLLVAVLFPAILYVVWSFRICGAREKNPVCGVLLLVPGVNMGALIYLAFSK